MTKPTEAFTLPYEAAEIITVAYLKRELVWLEAYRDQPHNPPMFSDDMAALIDDITAIRRVVWWMTGDLVYDDQK